MNCNEVLLPQLLKESKPIKMRNLREEALTQGLNSLNTTHAQLLRKSAVMIVPAPGNSSESQWAKTGKGTKSKRESQLNWFKQ